MSASERTYYYDVMRASAITLIILTFASGLYGNNTSSLKLSVPLFLNCIASIGVPLFFMLTGALLLNRNYGLDEFFKNRFKRTALPYIFWIIIAAIFGVLILNLGKSSLSDFIFNESSPFTAMWTLACAYLAMPIYNSFTKVYKLRGLEIYLALWLFTVILMTFDQYPLFRIDLVMFSYYMGFMILGYYLDNRIFALSESKMCILGLAVFILSTLIHMAIAYNNIDLYFPYLNFVVAVQSAGFFVFIRYLKLKRFRFKKPVTSLSICSYGMYFISYLAVILAKHMNIVSLKMLPAIFIISFVISWAAMILLSKIPYLKKVTGADYKWL